MNHSFIITCRHMQAHTHTHTSLSLYVCIFRDIIQTGLSIVLKLFLFRHFYNCLLSSFKYPVSEVWLTIFALHLCIRHVHICTWQCTYTCATKCAASLYVYRFLCVHLYTYTGVFVVYMCIHAHTHINVTQTTFV